MKIRKHEPMRNHTTWRIGGFADVLIQPESIAELQQILQEKKVSGEPYCIIGGGSNLLVSDAGIAGTVIKLGGSLCGLQIMGQQVVVEAGVPLPFLARKVAEQGLSGLEFAAGIPGTIGGAVVMNAGAYQSQISNIVCEVTCCNVDGQLVNLSAEECLFGYRDSRFKHNSDLVIVSVKMELAEGDKEEIISCMKKNTMSRNTKQPVEYPSAGSIFKNPPGDAAGRLIEQVGAKGWRQGDALVSEKHSNFIVNVGEASSKDVLQLITRVKTAVQQETGVRLEEEILFLGR